MKEKYQLSEYRAVSDFQIYGAKLVPKSGSLPDDKLDVILTEGFLEGYRISNKHTMRKSITFNIDDLDKDLKQAKMMGAKLLRRIEFENSKGKIKKFILMDQDWFKELLCQ